MPAAAAPFQLNCWQDINNFFNRAQHKLHEDFGMMERPLGTWGEWIEYDGTFPVGTGASSRVTLMGTRRPRQTNQWDRMAGLQPDCATSCTPRTQNIPDNAWDNRWYHLFETSFRSPVYCMTEMWLDALNLPRQIMNVERNLKEWIDEIHDDFYSGAYIANCNNKYVGIDNNTSFIRKGLWDFERDANGDPNIDRIIVDPSLFTQMNNVSLLTQDVLDYLDLVAYYNRSWDFMGSDLKPLIVDPITSQKIPQQDNNRRKDNRVFDPATLDPRLGYKREYAGWGHKPDMFMLRYNWDYTNPNYPNGVLQRVYHWTDEPVTSGVTDDLNPDYLNASFAIAVPAYRQDVVRFQNFTPPKSVGKDAKFEALTYAYEGVWNWINESNNITPANERKELGYWLADIRKAGKPDRYDLGFAVLYRLYDSVGVQRSCRPLSVTIGYSYYADIPCPPFDHYPPPMAFRTLCGTFSKAGCACAPCSQDSTNSCVQAATYGPVDQPEPI